ncbi:MAG: UDP-glucose 4-epimerase GalE [Candidatus Poribacteria bacterium]|nr:UDP-glucose 4-epimerase GalE [Candidatus Poribacteria bacterium]
MSTVLVTGGGGFIGSHTCKALANAGHIPVAYDDLSGGHRWAVKWGPFEHGDMLDSDRLQTVMHRYGPSAVIHCAGKILVGESVTDPATCYRNNVVGMMNLLDAMREHGVERIVFSSTCAVYGIPCEISIAESHPCEPINPYGRSKRMAEQLLTDFHHAYGVRSVILRYFNAAGADPDGEIGEAHEPETHLIPLLLDVAFGRRDRISIFGDDYDTPDGTCVRDYLHVCDIAAAHVLALEYLDLGGTGCSLNLGVGRGYTVREVVETVEAVTGRSIPTVVAERREGDAPVLVANARRAKTTLGWTPQFPDLATQVEHAWKWHRAHHTP